jgi:surface polysaccharide O-acyltransferase-like enzyme
MKMVENRLYFLDNLRSVIILGVVVLHVAICYMMYPPVWWYVVNPVTNLYFTQLVVLVDVPLMPCMFFIAGYFALPSLQRHGVVSFLQQKTWRIFIPWVLGIVLLAPPTAFSYPYSRNMPVDLYSFWTHYFWTDAFQHSVYWFLALLFWLFVALTIIWKCVPALRNVTRTPAQAPLWLFPAVVGVSASCFFIALQFFPLDYWYVSYLLSFRPERLVQLVVFFILGMWAWKYGWFTQEGYRPRKRVWLPLFVLTMVIYLPVRLGFVASPIPLWQKQIILACAFTTYSIASLMGLCAVFSTWVNGKSAFWRSASKNSYGIYYLHAPIVYWLAYAFIPLAWSTYVKSTVILVLSMAASWMFTAGVLRKAPLLKRMF